MSPLTNSLSFVAAACSEAQVSYTSTENDDIHLQVSLSWHGIHWITDASSKLLGYIINSKLHLKLKDLTSLIPRPHIDFIAPLRSWAKGLLATVATQDKQFS